MRNQAIEYVADSILEVLPVGCFFSVFGSEKNFTLNIVELLDGPMEV